MTWKEEVNDLLWGRPTPIDINGVQVNVSRDIIVTLQSVERDIDESEITDQTIAALRSAINRLEILRRILNRG